VAGGPGDGDRPFHSREMPVTGQCSVPAFWTTRSPVHGTAFNGIDAVKGLLQESPRLRQVASRCGLAGNPRCRLDEARERVREVTRG